MRVLHPRSSRIRPFSKRTAWLAVLVLSPLTYLGSYYLAKMLPSRNSVITLNREKAIQLGLQFAETRHIDARGWKPSVGTEKHKDLALVFAHVRPPALEQVTAASVARVRFLSPDAGKWIRVDLTPVGHVIGFWNTSPPGPPAVITDDAAQSIATSFLRDFLGPASRFELKPPNMHFVDKKKQYRMFEWKTRAPDFSQAEADFQVQLFGDQVVSEECDVSIEGSYLKQFRPARILNICLMAVSAIYLLVIGIYAVVRYVRRTSEKEVSHRRTILVALIFTAFSVFAIYYGAAESSMSVDGQPPTSAQKIVLLGIFAFTFSLMGAFFGMAYGAGEGDVRAVYPGKLTSLDALLSGKLFSANVARSLLAGCAFAGVMLLVQNVAHLATRAVNPVSDNEILSSLITSAPLGEAISDTALNAVAIAAFGLLVPIAFLRPRVRKEWVFYALLPLFSMLCATIWSADQSAWRNLITTLMVSVAAACLPFFYGDLLAAISSIVALDLTAKLIYRSAVSERWAQISAPVVFAGVGFILMEVYFAWRGRMYEEAEVRPLYARFLAEHLSLQAEIGAARQAQLRLLPDAPPRIVGLTIAGSCVPAREVGGDFYDFYALDDHRLGVFLAEGGNGELGSAMTIALAKGYLLYTARLDLGPVEILRRLREVLGATLNDGNASMSMLYAVIDARSATLRFARAGESPRLVLNGNSVVEEVVVSGADQMIFRHGVSSIAPKDALVFYTDGLTAQIAEEKRERVDEFLAKTALKTRDASAAELHSAILKAAIKRKSELRDDVTAVVIRLDEPGEQVIEGVA